jgi:hypothetical protein
MTSTRFVHLVVGIISCTTVAPELSKASVVYSSFVSGTTWQCCAGIGVSGPFSSEVQNQEAAAFTPASDYTLAQIDVAFYFNTATPDTNGFILSLNQDSGGLPGSVIETWTGLIAPTDGTIGIGNFSSVVETVSVSAVSVLAGHQYWIVASPAASTSLDVWSINTFAGTGPGGITAFNHGSGWVGPEFGTSNDIAFDVRGTTTPEPGTLMLPILSTALIGLGLIGRLRRS